MRVLQVYNRHRFGGGADVVADATVRLLAESGADVTAFCRDSAALPPGLPGRLAAALGGLYPRRTRQEFRRCLDTAQPDIVHAHELYPLISPWILPVCAERHIPVLLTCHDYRLTCPVATHFRNRSICTACRTGNALPCLLHNCRGNLPESLAFTLRSALATHTRLFRRHLDHIVTPSAFLRDWLIDSGWPADRISVVPNPVDDPGAPPLPVEAPYVAFAGRAVPEKGLDALLDALHGSSIPLQVAGPFPEANCHDKHSNIRFLGLLDPEQMVSFFAAARIVVVPSTWMEPFGLVAAEAALHRKPVIASRIGGLPELVRHETSGLLVHPGDSNDLRTAITRLWPDIEGCRRMGETGRRHIQSTCSPARYVERLLALYAAVLRDRAGPHGISPPIDVTGSIP